MLSIALYATLDGADTRFDGHRAQTHLTHALGMRAMPVGVEGDSAIGGRFREWLERHREAVSLNGRGTVVLVTPVWFR